MFKIEIETGNAAFTDEAAPDDDRHDDAALGQEIARILRKIATDLVDGGREGVAIDANGNTVGRFEVKP